MLHEKKKKFNFEIIKTLKKKNSLLTRYVFYPCPRRLINGRYNIILQSPHRDVYKGSPAVVQEQKISYIIYIVLNGHICHGNDLLII